MWFGRDETMTAEDGNGEEKVGANRRDITTVAVCAGIVLAMIGLSYAAVPLYRLYCQATGYAGTTQRAAKPSETVLDRTLTVRFDANVSSDLPWRFEPLQKKLDVKIGENALALYRATNTSDKPVTGTAVFNVAPENAGLHFNKVQCFCFTEQTLAPGQTVDMAVSFYIDPGWVDDEDTKEFSELTLSYTFYPAQKVQEKTGKTAASKESTRTGG
jgi:cytochrome c oxidase assembly protein subunit 11